MNRLNYFDLSDASVVKAYRVAAMARYVAGCVVIGGILLASALTGCQPASGNSALNAGVGQPAPPQTTDASPDNQFASTQRSHVLQLERAWLSGDVASPSVITEPSWDQ